MTKKFVVLVLLVVLAVPVFAVESYVGISVGSDFSWVTRNIKSFDTNTTQPLKANSIGISVQAEGANYFDSFGVGYQVGVMFPLSRTLTSNGIAASGNDTKSFMPTLWNVQLTGRYRFDINRELVLEAGLGLEYSFGTYKGSFDSSSNASITHTYLTIVGDAGVKYDLTKDFSLRGGLNVGVPVYSTMKVSATGISISPELTSTFGVTVTPYVGVVYNY